MLTKKYSRTKGRVFGWGSSNVVKCTVQSLTKGRVAPSEKSGPWHLQEGRCPNFTLAFDLHFPH